MKEIFTSLVLRYSVNPELASSLWEEISKHYEEPLRHYHNLGHIAHVYNELLPCIKDIEDWDAMVFAAFYHDIIYDPAAKDNEIKSALLAEKRMKELAIPVVTLNTCLSHIYSSRDHKWNNGKDTAYFLDADLSILGADWEEFKMYSEKIRLEYASIPEEEFIKKRKEVLKEFLDRERIFITHHFFSRYEKTARLNLEKAVAW